MKRTLAYNRYPLVICALGLLLGGLHSLFQLHQTPADTWTAAYLTAREGTELMLTENSTDPQVLRSLLHLLIGVPLLGGLFSRGYAVKGIFAATRRGRYLHFYRAEMGATADSDSAVQPAVLRCPGAVCHGGRPRPACRCRSSTNRDQPV